MGGHRWRGWVGALVGALVLSALAACGGDDDEGDTSTTSEASTVTTVGTSTTRAEPAATQEQAIAAWVVSESAGRAGPYLGRCPVDFDAELPLDGLCSVPLEEAADRSVQGLGPPFSEIAVFLLLEVGTDGWVVRDSYSPAEPYDLSDAPRWLPEEPTPMG